VAINRGTYIPSLHGKIYGIVYSRNNGRNFARQHIKPTRQKFSKTWLAKSYFHEAKVAWLCFSDSERQYWNDLVTTKKRGLGGYQYFISNYIDDRLGGFMQLNADWNSVSGPTEILNKPSIPAAQIQSDWNQTNNSQLDFIKNKPIISSGNILVQTLNLNPSQWIALGVTPSVIVSNANSNKVLIPLILSLYCNKFNYSTNRTLQCGLNIVGGNAILNLSANVVNSSKLTLSSSIGTANVSSCVATDLIIKLNGTITDLGSSTNVFVTLYYYLLSL
jgi:hypothetical protein